MGRMVVAVFVLVASLASLRVAHVAAAALPAVAPSTFIQWG